jgi:hypothetical protein
MSATHAETADQLGDSRAANRLSANRDAAAERPATPATGTSASRPTWRTPSDRGSIPTNAAAAGRSPVAPPVISPRAGCNPRPASALRVIDTRTAGATTARDPSRRIPATRTAGCDAVAAPRSPTRGRDAATGRSSGIDLAPSRPDPAAAPDSASGATTSTPRPALAAAGRLAEALTGGGSAGSVRAGSSDEAGTGACSL